MIKRLIEIHVMTLPGKKAKHDFTVCFTTGPNNFWIRSWARGMYYMNDDMNPSSYIYNVIIRSTMKAKLYCQPSQP